MRSNFGSLDHAPFGLAEALRVRFSANTRIFPPTPTNMLFVAA